MGITELIKNNFLEMISSYKNLGNEIRSLNEQIDLIKSKLRNTRKTVYMPLEDEYMYGKHESMSKRIEIWYSYPETIPFKGGRYLVTTNDGSVEIRRFIKEINDWDYGLYNNDVIAWMKLPGPSPKWDLYKKWEMYNNRIEGDNACC